MRWPFSTAYKETHHEAFPQHLVRPGRWCLTAAAFSSVPTASASTTPALKYNCSAKVFGTTQSQGVWTATVSAALPAKVAKNATIPVVKITAKVNTSTSAADTLRSLSVKNVKGSSNASYTTSGAVVSPGSRTASLTVPTTSIPKTGALTTTATGTAKAEKAGKTAGSVVVKVGNFTADLTTDSGFKIPTTCTAGERTEEHLGHGHRVLTRTATHGRAGQRAA